MALCAKQLRGTYFLILEMEHWNMSNRNCKFSCNMLTKEYIVDYYDWIASQSLRFSSNILLGWILVHVDWLSFSLKCKMKHATSFIKRTTWTLLQIGRLPHSHDAPVLLWKASFVACRIIQNVVVLAVFHYEWVSLKCASGYNAGVLTFWPRNMAWWLVLYGPTWLLDLINVCAENFTLCFEQVVSVRVQWPRTGTWPWLLVYISCLWECEC